MNCCILPRFRLSFFWKALLFLFLSYPVSAGDSLLLHVLDVGYGDAMIIQLPYDGGTIMVDAGSKEQADRVISYLKQRQITSLDMVIITHPHDNHFGGLSLIREHINVKKILVNGATDGDPGYQELLDSFISTQIPVVQFKKGDLLLPVAFPVQLEVLHPGNLTGDTNNDSAILLLSYDEMSILLTADVGPEVQDQVLVEYVKKLEKVDYVQIPHHGNDISDEFCKFFQGNTFFISTGNNGEYPPVRANLSLLAGGILRTDWNGVIVIESDGAYTWHTTVK